MTLYAPDGLQIVMMERFEPLTSAVDCNGDDGMMSLTFKSKEAFQRALDTWSFINQAPEKEFLLIANHDGCGPQDERQAYRYVKFELDRIILTSVAGSLKFVRIQRSSLPSLLLRKPHGLTSLVLTISTSAGPLQLQKLPIDEVFSIQSKM